MRNHLSPKADFLRRIYQTHRFYPILRYFHYREPYYALPRILLLALDTATLVRSTLDREHYRRLLRSPSLDDLFHGAMCSMRELSDNVPPRQTLPAEAEAWRKR